jgi:hypothetical protein
MREMLADRLAAASAWWDGPPSGRLIGCGQAERIAREWVADVLAADAMREAVTDALCAVIPAGTSPRSADAALTAVRAALGIEGADQ